MTNHQFIFFIVFVLSLFLGIYLLSRFISKAKKLNLLSNEELEDLSQLIISGSGGSQKQLRALNYILMGKYKKTESRELINSGNAVRISWFIILFIMILCVMSMAVKN